MPANIPDEKIQRQLEGQAQQFSVNISSWTPWLDPPRDVDPGLEYGNTVEGMDKGSIAGDRRLWKQASSESTGLERKSVPPPPIASTGVRAFNATDMLPPNPTITRNVIGERAPDKSPLSQLYPQNQKKVHAGTAP
jgi:hypothetical protein